jgi:CRP-like cAMP-binding protein
MRPPPPRERRPPAPPPPPPPPERAPLPSFPLERPSSPFDLQRGDASDTVVPPESDRDTEAPPDPFTSEPSPESLPAFSSDATETSISAEVEAALGSLSEAPPASEPTVAAEMPFSRPPSQAAAAPSPPPPPSVEPLLAGVSLADVRGLQDLPEEAQAQLVSKARIERLSRNDELTGFGVALVLEGWISIMPAIAEVPCARATAGDVVCTSGTLDEAIVLSAVAGQEQTAVALWDKSMLEEATQDCPWVADELRLIADRYQTLAGVTMGAMGDRLDESLRAMVTERCEVRALMPYEVLVEKGGPVPALHIVGAGRIEIVEGAGDNAEVLDELGPGDFLFAAQVLQGGAAPSVARAGKSGALVLFAERKVAHELLVSVPPLLEIFAT